MGKTDFLCAGLLLSGAVNTFATSFSLSHYSFTCYRCFSYFQFELFWQVLVLLSVNRKSSALVPVSVIHSLTLSHQQCTSNYCK